MKDSEGVSACVGISASIFTDLTAPSIPKTLSCKNFQNWGIRVSEIVIL
jgi:hypothetical protein